MRQPWVFPETLNSCRSPRGKLLLKSAMPFRNEQEEGKNHEKNPLPC